MLEPFDSPKALFRRSQEHLREFDHRFITFIAREPYARVIKPDSETADNLHAFAFFQPIPDVVTVVAYDVVNTLRSALDHAVYASAVAFGKGNPEKLNSPSGIPRRMFSKMLREGAGAIP